jgi:tetratricopeptide (TPR) repeat protein
MDLTEIAQANADLLFSATVRQQDQLDALSNQALTNGIDLYMSERYEDAADEFKRAIGLSPQGLYASDAANYLSNAYLKMGKSEKAIDAYKQSIRLNPYRDDTHISLGNLYYSLERFKEAESEYLEAYRINPSGTSQYSLGQVYLEMEQFSDAQQAFNKVKQLDPDSINGDFGIGLSFSAQGRYEDAIGRFEAVIAKDNRFYDAYAEMGFAFADLGKMEEAQGIVDFLENQDESSLADTLSRYMYKVDPPKIMYANASSSFAYGLSVNTPVAALDAYLANADTSRSFTMTFQFDKKMDRGSVENILNWEISRADGIGAKHYNYGLPAASTEVSLPPFPQSVYYDEKNLTATLRFSISQNATADGTIDPSHIAFTFKGVDEYGLKMDPKADQFTGFSGAA